MSKLDSFRLFSRGTLTLFACSLFLTPAVAQEADVTADEEESIEEIVTTGSRIRKDTFSTTTPIQVLDTEEAERLGINSISELLQKATVASGEQIDASFNASAGQTNATETPPDGGVGSACINLRGLGCERTLVLINDKRLGLAGIRGAPPQPDINMIPIGMVEGVDILTGGLSTIYGADAVAGVVNVRLKKDFEGLSFTASTEQTEQEGGEIYQASLVGGVGSDVGNFTFGIEASRQERVTAVDRKSSECQRFFSYGYSQTLDGRIVNNCSSPFIDNYIIMSDNLVESGQISAAPGLPPLVERDQVRFWLTPGSSNIVDANGNPIPNFSSAWAFPDPCLTSDSLGCIDGNNPELRDGEAFNRFRFTPLGQDNYDREIADLWRPYERFSLVTNGHLDLGWGNNSEAYFEGYYFNRQNNVIGATEQQAPTVLGQVPLVDSRNIPLLCDPAITDRCVAGDTGEVRFVQNPLNPFGIDVSPIVTIGESVPQVFDTELQQSRLVAGLLGDLSQSGVWSYDVSVSYDRATGFVSQPILMENHLFYSTQNVGMLTEDDGNGGFVASGELTCSPPVRSDLAGVFTIPDCVVSDWLNPSIGGDPLNGLSGSFATQAEQDYLVQRRINRTVTETKQFMAFVFGDLFDFPGGGTVGTAFGVEYRVDAIDSQNDAVGVLGLNNAENPGQEGETRGERDTFDAYAEISAPVVVDASWANLFQIDAAIRFTDDENFGTDTVYKIGALWDINDYLSFSTSFNTSFRAPNLREQFLADQAGALAGSNDPCRQPAVDLIEPGPGKDRLIGNCILSGADPAVLGNSLTVAIPTTTGGAAGLDPETSESLTATLAFTQPWTDRFDFDVALTYFDIEIEDTVRSLDPQTIVRRCYFDAPDLASPFCDRVERNRPTAPPELNFISQVRAGFVNTGVETTQGYDVTTRLTMDIGRASVLWSTASTFLTERLSQEFKPTEADPDGSPIVDDVGRIGNPELTFQSTVSVGLGAWDVIWQARWFDDTQYFQGVPNPFYTDEDGNIIGGRYAGQAPLDVFDAGEYTEYQYVNSALIAESYGATASVTKAEGQMHHDLAVSYNAESFTVSLGINNVLDEAPPIISWDGGPNRNGAVTSARYDQIGRSYFMRLVANF
jgi:iron complex outermembrane receptor protein